MPEKKQTLKVIGAGYGVNLLFLYPLLGLSLIYVAVQVGRERNPSATRTTNSE
jgi:hypothetical protein